MAKYAIEKGIPLPPALPERQRDPHRQPSAYPWYDMEIGDSFLVAETNPRNMSGIAAKLRTSASHNQPRSGRVFTVRHVEGGVRAWRTA